MLGVSNCFPVRDPHAEDVYASLFPHSESMRCCAYRQKAEGKSRAGQAGPEITHKCPKKIHERGPSNNSALNLATGSSISLPETGLSISNVKERV